MLAYFALLRKVIRRPSEFFAADFFQYSSQEALTFALITAWLGAGFRFSWSHLIPSPPMNLFTHLMQRYHGHIHSPLLEEWVVGAGFALLDPFLTLYSIMISSLVIFMILAVRRSQALEFSIPLKIVAFASCASIFLVLPPVLAEIMLMVYSLALTTIGIREVFSLSTPRSLLLALSPSFFYIGLILTLLLCGLIIAGLIFFFALSSLLTL